MKKEFEVRLQSITYATVYVEAEDWEQAEAIALSPERLSGLAVEDGDWEIFDVEEV